MTRVAFTGVCFFVAILLTVGGALGKTYYRWTDNAGVTQISDEPPKDRKYETIVIEDEGAGGTAPVKSGEASGGKAGAADDAVKKRQEEVLRDLEEKIAHYSEVGGITAGKLAALKDAAWAVKNAKMDGSEKDDEFYLKIEALVRAIKDHTAIIGRVHRLLNEAKAIKGLASPQKAEGTGFAVMPVNR